MLIRRGNRGNQPRLMRCSASEKYSDPPRLTSILGQIVVLRFWGRLSRREAEAEFAAVEPGDRGGLVGEAGVDEDGVVGA